MKNIFVSRFNLLILLLLLFACMGKNKSDDNEIYDIKRENIQIRDPFVYVDQKTKTYYVPANSGSNTIMLYKSKDLENWKNIGDVFIPDSIFWGKKDFWAPDLFEYKGKYYLFVTFSSETGMRGTSILVADNPEGKYKPQIGRASCRERV